MRIAVLLLCLLGGSACADESKDSLVGDVTASTARDDRATSAAGVRSTLSVGPLQANNLVASIQQNESSRFSNGGGHRNVAYSAVFENNTLDVAGILDNGEATFESGFARLDIKHGAELWRAKSGTLSFVASGSSGTIGLNDVLLVSNVADAGLTLGPISGVIQGSLVSDCPVDMAPAGFEQTSRILSDGGSELCP